MKSLVARGLAKALKYFPGSKTYNLHCFGCDSPQVISAMDHHSPSPLQAQTCVLKMHDKCENCLKKVKRMLQKINGVHSINIDADEGKVVVSSTIDPHQFISMLARAGKRAEILSVSSAKPQAPQPAMMNSHKKMQYLTPDQIASLMDSGINKRSKLAQFQEFAKNPRLKQVELNQSMNIKMMFKDSDKFGSSSSSSVGDNRHIVEINNMDDHVQNQGPDSSSQVQEQNGDAYESATSMLPPPTPEPTPPSPSLKLKNPCGGYGEGSSSSVHCFHDRPQVEFACSSGGPFSIKYMEEPVASRSILLLPSTTSSLCSPLCSTAKLLSSATSISGNPPAL
ncbi:hypothetical protein COLO4_09124 [Corchorus olitorius]|uniref:HMA domain-containing protein n=1 Tax=Corchorus olitorius TaxID=93759 RepID=A0A1R3KD52_9ROSI|nr:hypothetical protein COLO4_09124 [Corchorus olitorius]